MQTKRLDKARPPISLKQGHIFNLAKLKFEDNGQFYTFKNFYPHLSLTSAQKGVVVTQTCDLEHRKSPYITVGILEPLKKNLFEFLDETKKSVFLIRDSVAFYNREKYQSSLENQLKRLISNQDAYNFFLSLNENSAESFHFVNLTKLFPLRCENYETILKSVTHEIRGDFQHLIGWKMANLYGRVGVKEYTKEKYEKIVASLALKSATRLRKWLSAKPVEVKPEDFQKLNKLYREHDQLPHGPIRDKKTKEINSFLVKLFPA